MLRAPFEATLWKGALESTVWKPHCPADKPDLELLMLMGLRLDEALKLRHLCHGVTAALRAFCSPKDANNKYVTVIPRKSTARFGALIFLPEALFGHSGVLG